jgi:hypothetical protein
MEQKLVAIQVSASGEIDLLNMPDYKKIEELTAKGWVIREMISMPESLSGLALLLLEKKAPTVSFSSPKYPGT